MDGKRDATDVADMLQEILVKPPLFELLADFGSIIVPAEYLHGTVLDDFKNQYQKKFRTFPDRFSDETLPRSGVGLRHRKKLRVRAYVQRDGYHTLPAQCMEFLRSKGAIFPGLRGLCLVFAQKFSCLPDEHSFFSFEPSEEQEYCKPNLPGLPLVQGITVEKRGRGRCSIIDHQYNQVWFYRNHSFLCFTEELNMDDGSSQNLTE